MKMLRWLPVWLAAGWLLTGCGKLPSPAGESVSGQGVPLFQEKKGLRLPDEMKKDFGVEVAEGAERTMQREVRKLARVYREPRDGAPGAASLMLTAGEAEGFKPGQAVRLKAAGADGEFDGTVVRLDGQTQSAVGQAEVLVEFADRQQRIPGGAFLTATFNVGPARLVLAVPSGALLDLADGTFVYAVNGEHFTRTRVKAGAAADGFVGIEDGLYSGDMVVTKGIESLWLIELSALKGGKPCCAAPKKEPAATK